MQACCFPSWYWQLWDCTCSHDSILNRLAISSRYQPPSEMGRTRYCQTSHARTECWWQSFSSTVKLSSSQIVSEQVEALRLISTWSWRSLWWWWVLPRESQKLEHCVLLKIRSLIYLFIIFIFVGCVSVCVQNSAETVMCPVPSLYVIFPETRLLTELGVNCFYTAGWPVNPNICLSLCLQSWGYRHARLCLFFLGYFRWI